MSTSHLDPDRLADSALGPGDWSDAEAAHVAGCAECRLELELLGAARRLGGVEVAGLGGGRVAQRVLARLAEAPPAMDSRASRGRGRWLLGLAAAAALVLAVRYGLPRPDNEGAGAAGPVPVAVSVLQELDGLSASQLEEVLESIPPAAEAMPTLEVRPYHELNVNDLERVLRSMEE